MCDQNATTAGCSLFSSAPALQKSLSASRGLTRRMIHRGPRGGAPPSPKLRHKEFTGSPCVHRRPCFLSDLPQDTEHRWYTMSSGTSGIHIRSYSGFPDNPALVQYQELLNHPEWSAPLIFIPCLTTSYGRESHPNPPESSPPEPARGYCETWQQVALRFSLTQNAVPHHVHSEKANCGAKTFPVNSL